MNKKTDKIYSNYKYFSYIDKASEKKINICNLNKFCVILLFIYISTHTFKVGISYGYIYIYIYIYIYKRIYIIYIINKFKSYYLTINVINKK